MLQDLPRWHNQDWEYEGQATVDSTGRSPREGNLEISILSASKLKILFMENYEKIDPLPDWVRSSKFLSCETHPEEYSNWNFDSAKLGFRTKPKALN